eukprot:scaffold21250_cov111-Isochrysis_galbana.AAC.1
MPMTTKPLFACRTRASPPPAPARCGARCLSSLLMPDSGSTSAPRLGAARKLPSSRLISRFSSRLLSKGSTLRSAFSTPSRMSTRPRVAARSGGASEYKTEPPRSSRLCFRSASDVSRVTPTYSTSSRRMEQSQSTRSRTRPPGSPRSSMSWPKRSWTIIQRAVASASCDVAIESDSAVGTHGTSSGASGTDASSSTPPIAIDSTSLASPAGPARPEDGSGRRRAGTSPPPDSKYARTSASDHSDASSGSGTSSA